MKDTRSLLLVLLSVCVVGTWVYHIYDKNEFAKHPNIVYVRQGPVAAPIPADSSSIDSVQTISQLNQANPDSRMDQLLSFRREIESQLADTSLSRKDLNQVAEKIRALQQLLSTLSSETDSLLRQKEKMNELRTGDGNADSRETATTTTPAVKTVLDDEKEYSTTKEKVPGTFSSSRLSLKAMNQYENDKWQLTMQAKNTNEFTISFSVNNPNTSFRNTPIYLVLTDPKGNIIQDDLWEGGILSTQDAGIIRYTRRVNVEYTQGSTKKVNLAIQLPNFLKGKYKLQVYHNNQIIGKTNLALY